MGLPEQRPISLTFTAGEAISAGMAVSVDTDGTVVKLVTTVAGFVGVARYAAVAGEPVTVDCGPAVVNVQVNGTGSAGDGLTAGADAGKLDASSAGTDPLVGYAFAAWTADDVVSALIYPGFPRVAIA